MACKFRSIQLCRSGFRGLKRNIENGNGRLGNENGNRNNCTVRLEGKSKHEHIST